MPELPDDFDSVLVVVAHPDDAEYGIGAAVARWTREGKKVAYTLASRGEAGIAGLPPEESGPLREQEQRAACTEVGVSALEFLDHPDGRIEPTLQLRADIAGAIRRHRPQLVVTLNADDTWFGQHWNSADHRHLGRSVLDAVADAGNEWIFRELTEPPWAGVKRVGMHGTAPTHRVAVDDEAVQAAVRSLSRHARYLEALSDEPVADQSRTVVERACPADDDGRRWISLRIMDF
ncbi:PIG-L family deacetylase [Nakamurella sp. YIM 132087]|uniref:PIG-L family deacetylase n=1 Tax=Nakamurella alba TaxID=2665158 RepID=A0A7K1FMM9_9ACTN|nr:PIG-L family deacetylase [Nakamurella alba]